MACWKTTKCSRCWMPCSRSSPGSRLICKAMKSWRQQRANYLANCGRGDESLAIVSRACRSLSSRFQRADDLRAKLAKSVGIRGAAEVDRSRFVERHAVAAQRNRAVPRQLCPVVAFAGTLRRIGRLPRGLDRRKSRKRRSLRTISRRRFGMPITPRKPDALLDKWFQEGRRNDAPPAVYARLHAAINWVLNQINNYWIQISVGIPSTSTGSSSLSKRPFSSAGIKRKSRSPSRS